jgi:hypothetical protein
VIWAGRVKRKDWGDEKAIPVIIKASWLPVERREHELDVIDKLNNVGRLQPVQLDNDVIVDPSDRGGATKTSASDDEDHAERILNEDEIRFYLSELDYEVIQAILQSLGMVHQQTPLMTFTTGQDGLQDGHARLQPGLVFTPIAIKQPEGEVITAGSSMTFWRYLGDTYQALFLASLRGVHHRDANLGNMMSCSPTDGRKFGMLIDYGNAILEGAHSSDTLEDVQDACRSANQMYRCSDLAIAMCTSQNHMDWPSELTKRDLQALKGTYRHRYVDDMESFLYCHCHLASPDRIGSC